MSKTVKEHFEDCKKVSEVVDNANALLTKTQKRLLAAREVLEALVDYQHPKLMMDVKYKYNICGDEDKCSPSEAIRHEIKQINALLGDRA